MLNPMQCDINEGDFYRGEAGGGGGACSTVSCLTRLTIDHASLSRRATVPAPDRDSSNSRALVTLFPYITQKRFASLTASITQRGRGHARPKPFVVQHAAESNVNLPTS